MRTIFITMLLCLSLSCFGQTAHVQYDSLTERYYAEIEPMQVIAGSDTFVLSRVYVRTVSDTTINVFISYALPFGEGYTSFVKAIGLRCAVGEDAFACAADKIEIPSNGIGSPLQSIIYR